MSKVFSRIYIYLNHIFKTKEERALIKLADTDEVKLDQEFGRFLAKTNVLLATKLWLWIMYVITIVRFCHGIRHLADFFNLNTPEKVYFHMLYMFMFLLTVVVHILCLCLRNQCNKHYGIVCFIIDGYLFFFTVASFFVTFVDPQKNMVGYSIVIAFIIISYTLYMRPMSTVFTTVTISAAFICSYFFFDCGNVIDLSALLRILIVASITCVSSIIRYRGKYTSYLNERNISSQRDELKKLNKELEINKEQLQYRNKQLQYVSSTDLLTGISNRRKFVVSSDAIIQELSEKNQFLTVAVVDIDNFKQINDTNGHLIGDACLIQIGKEFKKIENEKITCYRFGGDEFIALFKGMSRGEAFLVIDNLAKEVANIQLVGYDKIITLSIGIHSEIPKYYQRIDYFIEKADQLLYEAKSSGKNRIKY